MFSVKYFGIVFYIYIKVILFILYLFFKISIGFDRLNFFFKKFRIDVLLISFSLCFIYYIIL